MHDAIAHPVDLVPSTVNPRVFCVPISNADGSPVGSNLADIGVTATADELNRLDGVGSEVTAANLTELTDGSVTALHLHEVNLGDLADVVLTNPQDGDTLVFDSGNWVNQAP